MKKDHLKRIIQETRASQNRNFTHIISWAAIGKDAIVDFLIFFCKITYAHWSFLSVVMRTTWNKLEIQQLLISSDARADSVAASVLSKPPQQRSVTSALQGQYWVGATYSMLEISKQVNDLVGLAVLWNHVTIVLVTTWLEDLVLCTKLFYTILVHTHMHSCFTNNHSAHMCI